MEEYKIIIEFNDQEGVYTASAPGIQQSVEGQTSQEALKKMEKLIEEIKLNETKRSFMLTESQIEKLFQMKMIYRNKTLSEIVGDAIDIYYDEFKK